jgi:hypothetical protein
MEGSNINNTKVPDRVVRMELIAFFTKHPETVDTPQSLAARLGRNENQIKHEMDELEQLGILRKMPEGDDFYAYIPAVSAKLSKKKAVINGNAGAAAAKRNGAPQTPVANRHVEEQARIEEEHGFEVEAQDANGSV